MRAPIVTPNLGLVESITVVEWLVGDGDLVVMGQLIAVIETEKAQVEIESPESGVIHIVVAAGPDLVPADGELGYIDAPPNE